MSLQSPPGQQPPGEPPLSLAQSQALWWARFIRDYGITTALSIVLLGVILGFIPAPMFSGAKLVETETRDSVARLESNFGVVLMRLETMSVQSVAVSESLDRVTCVSMLTAEQKVKLRTRADLDAQCLWLRGISSPPTQGWPQ